MSKADLIRAAVEAAKTDELEIVDPRRGWPATIRHLGLESPADFGIHIAPVGDFHRHPHEMRFQNPGQNRPIDASKGFPILLGIDTEEEPSILVAADAQARVGRTTRFSIRLEKGMLLLARAKGLARFVNNAGEEITAFRAEYLPSFLAASLEGVELPEDSLESITIASGLDQEDTKASADRARRAATVLIRDQSFGARVREAYEFRCAMCGLGSGLTVGAHIYPASAPDSPYVVNNGVCLCENHHGAYDAFLVWFEPDTYKISVRPDVVAAAGTDRSLRAFLDSTYERLRLPGDAADKPSREMVERRRGHFSEEYGWLAH